MSTQTALIPDHDPAPPVLDLGALEPKKKRHKPGTLRRALSWLRGRKKKKSEVKQQEGKDNSKTDGEPQPTPSQDDTPDNLFFPSGRTSVVEEIHSQAQEGLKSLQRREKQHSKHSFQDENKAPESIPETNENGFRTRSLSYTTENTDDAMCSRSDLIKRKGSTFRPYDSPITSNRVGRKRKEKRATVVGVPQHIASELGLNPSSTHRGIYDVFRREDGQLIGKKSAEIPVANGVQGKESEFVVIPTVDGNPASVPHGGARISLAVLEQTEAALKRHIDKVYHDDSCIGWKSGSNLSPLDQRPKSLAVPGMTTHSSQSDPVSPVMSISPQATYMSKIIPNAVLPPLVDVVALSRSSVRTLSRCSLATASPASVRGSLHRGRGMSCSSDTWSRSQSTETIVSDSSTISSRGGDNTLEANEKSGLSTGRTSPAPSTGTQDGSDAASLCSGRSSVRSVSLRKSKKAPPPPKRTYSLQQQKELGLPPRPDKKPTTKTNQGKDPWVPRAEKVSSDNDVFLPPLAGPKQNSPSRSDRTMSPSSGYSSQSGTPTMPVRSLVESPGSRRKTPPKPERSSLKSAVNSSVSSTTSVENNSVFLISPPRAGSSMGDQEGQDPIPPHPSVPAPSCPPPTCAVDVVTTVTPPPSPPTHHPTPPPARKSESDADTVPQVKETAQKESLWPPPPPENSDVQDLSMADFPPPEEELFLPPPPSVEPVTKLASSEPVSSNMNEKSDVLKAEMPMSTSNEESLNSAAALQPAPVPLNSTELSDAAERALVMENNSDPVPPPLAAVNTNSVVPPFTEPTVVPPVSSDTSITNEDAFIMYKPHFNTTPTTSEPKGTLDLTVPQESAGNQSLTTTEVNTTTSSVTTVPSTTVESPAPNVPSSVAVTSSVVSKTVTSPLLKSSTWKPVSAPGSKKESTTSQSIAVAQKEDANLPIVTPSLLQMVRLRSIQARVPQSPFSQSPTGLPAPQKPVRKSLSHRSPEGSDSSPVESPTAPPASPQKPPESPSTYRSPASAASFVFARGSKKFVFDPPASQDTESSLKKDVVAELKAHGGPRSPDEKPPLQRKPSKIPPPVARKPSVGKPRTPTTPPNSTGSTNGSVFTPRDPGLAASTSAPIASGTQAGHDQPQKSQTEQA